LCVCRSTRECAWTATLAGSRKPRRGGANRRLDAAAMTRPIELADEAPVSTETGAAEWR
jgi:hypothetical protein